MTASIDYTRSETAKDKLDSILEYGDYHDSDVTLENGEQDSLKIREKLQLNAKCCESSESMNETEETVQPLLVKKAGASNLSNGKFKLNPKAEQYTAKSLTASTNVHSLSQSSAPNLNNESVSSRGITQNKYSSYSDACKGVTVNGLYIAPSNFASRKTNMEMSQIADDEINGNPRNSFSSCEDLNNLLTQYINKKCSLNSYCNSEDFDGTALDGLTKLSFIQSLQAVEHYGASVSERIVKKPAYLMGIIRGQESHWDNSRAAAQLEGGALQLLHLPKRLLVQIGIFCLEGNCLPSDFTPEVILSLHSLTVEFALKSIAAFDSNKRIVAGCRGGVVNRPRFLQRLIENVIQQNPITLATIKKEQQRRNSKEEKDIEVGGEKKGSIYSSPESFVSLLGSNQSKSLVNNLPESVEHTPNSNGSGCKVRLSVEEKMKFLEREITERIERERRLHQELGNLRVQLVYWEKECNRLNTSITHILHMQGR